MTKQRLTARQKAFFLFFCFALAVTGFMIKLPSSFRHIDKELHAAFYFFASAVLTLLFAGTNLLRHVVISLSLYLFGMAIEWAQAYSNRFFRKRIHGRFDPEDIAWNLKGLLLFSLLWLVVTVVLLVYRRVVLKTSTDQRPKA